jgi:hypothetical protein
VKANGRIQNDQLFMRGSAMSGAPIIIGTIQLARPTKAGNRTEDHHQCVRVDHDWLKNSGARKAARLEQFRRDEHAMAPPMKNITARRSGTGTDVLGLGGVEPPLKKLCW